jgi:uncharacterized protein (TIGR02145 family)
MTTSCNKERIKIKGQVWMKENLNVDKFRNGDPISQAQTALEWIQAAESEQPAWCYYENDSGNGEEYGKLYNWHAVKDPRGLAPKGWKIPSMDDWERLYKNIGIADMKSRDGWLNNGNGTNESGFNAKPGGFRYIDGVFSGKQTQGVWWSSQEYQTYSVRVIRLFDSSNNALITSFDKACGVSVRCIKQ